MELLIHHINFNLSQFLLKYSPIIIGFGALLVSLYQIKRSEKSKKEEHQRSEIYKKLNDFYGPYIQLRKKSHILYQKFQKIYREKDPDFSTLKYLLNGHIFKNNEKALLTEIINIGNKCEELIHNNAGLIDDEELRNNLIPKASTHYLLLRLAFDGNLTGDIDNFIDSSFPNKIDECLIERKKELENQLKRLNE